MLHVLKVLLLPPAHGAEVKGAAAVEARQGGEVCTVQGILCTQTHRRGRKRDVDYCLWREVLTKLQTDCGGDTMCSGVTTAPSAA